MKQCPIRPGKNYIYSIDLIVEEWTIWFHTHSQGTHARSMERLLSIPVAAHLTLFPSLASRSLSSYVHRYCWDAKAYSVMIIFLCRHMKQHLMNQIIFQRNHDSEAILTSSRWIWWKKKNVMDISGNQTWTSHLNIYTIKQHQKLYPFSNLRKPLPDYKTSSKSLINLNGTSIIFIFIFLVKMAPTLYFVNLTQVSQ